MEKRSFENTSPKLKLTAPNTHIENTQSFYQVDEIV